MAHYSEMDFLFSDDYTTTQLNNTSVGNTRSIFNSKYTVYKKNVQGSIVAGTANIKNYIQENIYNNEVNSSNPYIKILKDPTFTNTAGTPGAGLRLKPSDFAYLRELGVYPINRMAILRRFPEGVFVPENLGLMNVEPISTIVGWIKPDDNFGTINFNESWDVTNKRFDEKIAEIVHSVTKIDVANLIPIPSFAQGMLFEIYKRMGITTSNTANDESDDPTTNIWGLNNIPVGNPNVLKEAPYRNAEVQNIRSSFEFELISTYEQKLIGDVDPGSALLDIIDNIYAMGTSNMAFYWSDSSQIIQEAKGAVAKRGNNINEWWNLVKTITEKFWNTLKTLFTETLSGLTANADYLSTFAQTDKATQSANAAATRSNQANINAYTNKIAVLKHNLNFYAKGSPNANDKEYATTQKSIAYNQSLLDKANEKGKTDSLSAAKNSATAALNAAAANGASALTTVVKSALGVIQTILTSTVAIHRFELRGSIELMTGGQDSAAPWHLTIGNPYSPWINTSHIIVKTCTLETSNEMGFNDMPQKLTAKFTCGLSRSLGKQELMRMFNNTYKREYTKVPTTPIQYNGETVSANADTEATDVVLPNVTITAKYIKVPGKAAFDDQGSIENYLFNQTGGKNAQGQNVGTYYTFQQRKVLAEQSGIENYTGTAEQNTAWLNSLKNSNNIQQ